MLDEPANFVFEATVDLANFMIENGGDDIFVLEIKDDSIDSSVAHITLEEASHNLTTDHILSIEMEEVGEPNEQYRRDRPAAPSFDVVIEEIPDLSGELATWYITDAAKKKKIMVMEITDDSQYSKDTHEILKEAALELGFTLNFSVKFSELDGLEYRFRQNWPGVMFIHTKRMLRWIDARIVAREMRVNELVNLINNMDI